MKAVLITILMVSAGAAVAEVKVATIDFPPLAIHTKTGQAAGMGVDLARELAKRTGLVLKDSLVQVNQLPKISDEEEAIFPMLARNAEREKHYRWVGKILDDKYCFATLKKQTPVVSLDVAKNLRSIGVNQGGATETFLVKNGFKNLDRALGNSGSIRKLNAGVLDAWFTSERVAFYSYKNEGKNPGDIVCSGDFARPAYWIAASVKMPAGVFKKLQAAYEALEKEGFVQQTISKYE